MGDKFVDKTGDYYIKDLLKPYYHDQIYDSNT